MFNHDEGSMPYNLGEAAFNAVFERIASVLGRIPEQFKYVLMFLAILVAAWLVIVFLRRMIRGLEQDRINQEALLNIAHQDELPSGR